MLFTLSDMEMGVSVFKRDVNLFYIFLLIPQKPVFSAFNVRKALGH